MENKEIKSLSLEQLNKKATEVKKSLFEMRMKNTVGQLSNPIEIRDARKTIARILTAINNQKSVAPKTDGVKASVKKTVKKAKTSKTTKAKTASKKK